MPFHLEALQPAHFERLHVVFDAVCRERRFMAFTEAAPKEQTVAFYRNVVSAGHSHFVAVRGDRILGWCDVLPLAGQMRAHAGVLGMGVVAEERGNGIGRALIQAVIAKSIERGLSRIELTVHSENTAAQALYSSVGFVHEGTQRGGWLIDGRYFDVHHMARLNGDGPRCVGQGPALTGVQPPS